jgi:protein TonB
MRKTWFLPPMLGAVLMGGPIHAADPPAVPRSEQVVLDDANTDWTKILSKQVSALYPPKAYAAKTSGLVRLKCAASETGDLSGCTIESETPADQGFGAAALKLVTYMRLKPHIENGQAVAGTVTLPLNFQPDPDSKPAPLPRAP